MASPRSKGTRKNPLSSYTVSSADSDIRSGFARRSHEGARRENRKFHHRLVAESAKKRAEKDAEVADILNEYAKIYTHLKEENDKKDLKDVMEILAEKVNPSDERLKAARENMIPFWREKAGLKGGGRHTRRKRRNNKRSTKRRGMGSRRRRR